MGIYERLGIRPMINARGTISAIGGSLPHPAVLEAMAEASRCFVDTFAPIGAAITTADAVPDPHALRVQLWVNDELRQDFSTADMANAIPALIEFASTVTTLEPGDVIATGTNHQGLGALQDGDQVRLHVERLGELRVAVRDEQRRSWPRDIDQATAQRARS